MAIERKNPIPPNTYWLDVQGKNVPAFEAWLAKNKETVILDAREDQRRAPRSTPLPGSQGTIVASWFLFTVLQATLAPPATTFGFPTIAGGVKRKADTVQRPPVPTASDALSELLAPLVGSPTTLLAIAVGAYLLFSSKGKR